MIVSRSSLYFRQQLSGILRWAGIACFVLLTAMPFCAARNLAGDQPVPWVATWGTAMIATAPGTAPDFSGQTLRQIVHTSVAGRQARVWFSNRFGSQPLRIGAAHIALGTNASGGVNGGPSGANSDQGPDESAIQPGSDRALTFDGRGSVIIPPGATIMSDPVALDVPALSNLVVSAYFPGEAMGATQHGLALETSYVATGNVVDAASLAGESWPEHSWYFLSGVDVSAPGDSAVVAFGDSITDGAHSTPGENHRWPDLLAVRLAASTKTGKAGALGVVNAGIGGNRVLLDGNGPDAVSRVDPDILARSGARYLIVLESINDIGRYSKDHQPYGDLAQRLEWGLSQVAMQAHQHNMKVFGATLTPYGDCNYYSQAGEQVREAVNQWIRTSSVFDGVADFDQATRDPQHPLRFLPKYDSGDHLHPNDAGYQAMADTIDLKLFQK